MSPRQEDKKEPLNGNGTGNPGSSDEQEMDVVNEDDDLVEGEGELDLEGKLITIPLKSFVHIKLCILPEIAALNENIDNLNSVLDTIEQRADDMREKVMALLLSNREIRKELQAEKKRVEDGDGKDDEPSCNHPPGKPADEA